MMEWVLMAFASVSVSHVLAVDVGTIEQIDGLSRCACAVVAVGAMVQTARIDVPSLFVMSSSHVVHWMDSTGVAITSPD